MRGRAAREFRGSVLVADDHAVSRIGLMQLLQCRLNVTRFLEAERFEQAMDLLKERDLTLAIIDLLMPGLAGPRQIARVRALRPDVRVVVLSGSDARQDILDALWAGVHGYIIKTEALDQLIDRLRYILSGEIYVPPILAELPPQPPKSLDAPRTGRGARPGCADLSHRQRQVLTWLVEGKSNKEIAKELNVAEGTVKAHLAALFKTLGASNRAHAAALGKRLI
ncbi:MAG TPA: response regulator transcription factor [Hyphomicrobiaceae bacterium]|jgi:DNA-binding NarL/FixJ family response regulator